MVFFSFYHLQSTKLVWCGSPRLVIQNFEKFFSFHTPCAPVDPWLGFLLINYLLYVLLWVTGQSVSYVIGICEVENLAIIRELYDQFKLRPIKFIHCNSHMSPPKNKSSSEYTIWYGNFKADELATKACKSKWRRRTTRMSWTKGTVTHSCI